VYTDDSAVRGTLRRILNIRAASGGHFTLYTEKNDKFDVFSVMNKNRDYSVPQIRRTMQLNPVAQPDNLPGKA